MVHSAAFEGDFSKVPDIREAAWVMSAGEALAVDNDLVFALWGDGANPLFKGRVAAVKGSEANKPFGLTLPNSKFLEYVDPGRLSPDVIKLFEEPELLTNRSGALIFWRLPGRPEVEDVLPQTLWSRDLDGLPIVQNWSPEGKSNITDMLAVATGLGIEHPAVTSLNTTKQPEIIDPDKARLFARQHGLGLVTDSRAKRLMGGSYPVVIGDKEGLHVVRGRSGAVGTLILSRLMAGYSLDWAESTDVSPGWDSPELEEWQGPDLRSALLSMLGWTAIRTLGN